MTKVKKKELDISGESNHENITLRTRFNDPQAFLLVSKLLGDLIWGKSDSQFGQLSHFLENIPFGYLINKNYLLKKQQTKNISDYLLED